MRNTQQEEEGCADKISDLCQEMHKQLARCWGSGMIDKETYQSLCYRTELIMQDFMISYIAFLQKGQQK